jgi:Na+-translocating ferredoxin:NAD+ oxidoreductase RnfC subunit
MNKEKLEAAKKKLRKYAPVFAAASGIISTVYAISVVHNTKKNTITLTPDDREALQTGDVNIVYNFNDDGQSYAIRHIGNTPQK